MVLDVAKDHLQRLVTFVVRLSKNTKATPRLLGVELLDRLVSVFVTSEVSMEEDAGTAIKAMVQAIVQRLSDKV